MLQARLELYDEKSRAAPTAKLDGMPHGKGIAPDQTAHFAQLVLDTLDRLDTAQAAAEAARAKVEGLIYSILPDSPTAIRKISVLELRYLDGLKWPDVSRGLFGTAEDFDERTESYLRRTTALHQDAIAELSKKLK